MPGHSSSTREGVRNLNHSRQGKPTASGQEWLRSRHSARCRVSRIGRLERITQCPVPSDLLIPAHTGTTLTSCFAEAGFTRILLSEPEPSSPQADTVELTA